MVADVCVAGLVAYGVEIYLLDTLGVIFLGLPAGQDDETRVGVLLEPHGVRIAGVSFTSHG